MSDIVNGLTFRVPGSRLRPSRKKATCRYCGSIIIVGTDSKRDICEICAGNIRYAELEKRVTALEAELATR